MGLAVDLLYIGCFLIYLFADSTKLLRFSFLWQLKRWYIELSASLLNVSACCWAPLSLLTCIEWRHENISSSTVSCIFMRPVIIRTPQFRTLYFIKVWLSCLRPRCGVMFKYWSHSPCIERASCELSHLDPKLYLQTFFFLVLVQFVSMYTFDVRRLSGNNT